MNGQRYTKYESTFRELGVQVSGAQYIGRPRWGHPWHGGSFAKLFALALANFSKVLVLDSDCVVLRNIDHMAVFPAPSFRFQTVRVGNECQWELQSGVMVLEPDALEYERAIRLTTSLKSTGHRAVTAVTKVFGVFSTSAFMSFPQHTTLSSTS